MPPNDWPQLGAVEFRNVSLKYRSDAQPALKHISFLVEGGTKVGIVGRTGAGKTSLLAALLLLADDVCGSVLVDDIELAYLARRSFRARLGVVTQDLLLCSGPLRRILDLKGNFSDSDLWTALEEVSLTLISHSCFYILAAVCQQEPVPTLDERRKQPISAKLFI